MTIHYTREGETAVITLAGADDTNILGAADLAALGAAWHRFAGEDDARIAIITGAGNRAFCAGANVGELGPLLAEAGASLDLAYTMKNFLIAKPIIAAINGHAIGAGMEIMLATDVRIAVPAATFGLPEVRWGAIPVGGSVARLPRQVPYAWAMRLLLTGDRISAEQALAAGLITELVPPESLLTRARELASRILRNSPAAVRAVKECVARTQEGDLRVAHMIEGFYGDRVAASTDAAEGAQAFREGRQPGYRIS